MNKIKRKNIVLFIFLEFIAVCSVYLNFESTLYANIGKTIPSSLIDSNKLFLGLVLFITQLILLLMIIILDSIVIHGINYALQKKVYKLEIYRESILWSNIGAILVNMALVFVLRYFFNLNVLFLTYIPVSLFFKVIVLYISMKKIPEFSNEKILIIKIIAIYFIVMYIISLFNINSF